MSVRDKDDGDRTASAVERSLEDFIARANTTSPQATPEAQAKALGALEGQGKPPRTLVVLGPQTPLAEVTEIVNRMPAAELAAPRRRSRALLGFGLAFALGAVAVLLATRFISGTPAPVTPSVPPPVVVETAPPPRPVVLPMPVPTPVVEAAPAAVEPAPVPAPAVEPPPARRATKIARKAATPAEAPAKKAATGLVDPFAN